MPRDLSSQRLRSALRLKGSEKPNERFGDNCVILFRPRIILQLSCRNSCRLTLCFRFGRGGSKTRAVVATSARRGNFKQQILTFSLYLMQHSPSLTIKAAVKIAVPKAPWSAVAAATAFLPPSLALLPYDPKAAAATALQGASRIFIVGGAPPACGRLCGNNGGAERTTTLYHLLRLPKRNKVSVLTG